MALEYLPTEIITQIFLSLPDIRSAAALSATSHRFHSVFHSPQNLVILSSTAEAEFGPLDEIIQLVTHNASQPAHIRRKVPLSTALIKQVVQVGRVAQRWEETYPFKKWKSDFASRRLLTTDERYRVRRAVYRLWLFSRAFHNASNIRTCRSIPSVVSTRAALLHNFSLRELAEMYDVHQIMREVMRTNICPSNGRMRVKYQSRYPDQPHGLMFNIHLNYPPAPSSFIPESWFHNSPTANLNSRHHQPSRWLDPGAEGWGDDITHYYVVEDMLKLDPEQILHLRDHCPLKAQVEAYVKEVAGEWFINNGETFNETLAHVVRQRGGEMEELGAAVEEGEMGVAGAE
ncbi:uncharacterized protein LTR77_008505 [Saxophila tyrrhenica]|uniref:F-box domain-containing protein n=1 Tax=Saxophila tyrrhenica TaxID=1690608 RepID=A0AAV9P331_9PEZI|nr:hypothetical protein LTR77_008505 [Saxophila tyrrhenica]